MELLWALGNSRNRRPYVSRISTTSDFQSACAADPLRAGGGGGDWKHSPKRRYSRLLMFLSLALDLLVDCRDSAPGQFHSGFLSYEIRFRVVEPDEEFTRALDYKSARSRVLSLFFSFFSLSLSLVFFFFIEPTRVKLLWEIVRVYASVSNGRCAVITRDFQRCSSLFLLFSNRDGLANWTDKKIFNFVSRRFWQRSNHFDTTSSQFS